jgi:hypothetical protein
MDAAKAWVAVALPVCQACPECAGIEPRQAFYDYTIKCFAEPACCGQLIGSLSLLSDHCQRSKWPPRPRLDLISE